MPSENVIAEAPLATKPNVGDPLRSDKTDTDTRDIGPFTRLKFIIVRGFLWAWARCFSLKGLYWFGQFFGTCEYLINYKRRRRFHEYMKLVFGEDPHQWPQAAQSACWQHFMRTRCDKLFYLIFDKLPRRKILNRIKFENLDLLAEALKYDKGVYVAMSHNGSHHVLVLLMALLGYKVAGVRDKNEGALRRYVQQKYEETFPEFKQIRMFFADMYPRDLYRCFRDGFILGSALDVSRHRGQHLRTAKVQMFGREREFLIGPMQIALRCGAPILQAFVVSRKNFYFKVIGRGPLVDPETAVDSPEVIQTAMQQYADNIATHVAQYPDHLSKS
jgi:lauroyl/myristoyl acyltransferase